MMNGKLLTFDAVIAGAVVIWRTGGAVSFVTVRVVAAESPAPFVSVTVTVSVPSSRLLTSMGMTTVPLEPTKSIPFAKFAMGVWPSLMTTFAIAPA